MQRIHTMRSNDAHGTVTLCMLQFKDAQPKKKKGWAGWNPSTENGKKVMGANEAGHTDSIVAIQKTLKQQPILQVTPPNPRGKKKQRKTRGDVTARDKQQRHAQGQLNENSQDASKEGQGEACCEAQFVALKTNAQKETLDRVKRRRQLHGRQKRHEKRVTKTL